MDGKEGCLTPVYYPLPAAAAAAVSADDCCVSLLYSTCCHSCARACCYCHDSALASAAVSAVSADDSLGTLKELQATHPQMHPICTVASEVAYAHVH